MSPALAERRRRVSFIRRRIVATSITTFAVAWAAIFFQMVIGDDPGLAHKGTTTTASTPKASSTPKTTASSSQRSQSQAQQQRSPAPVTTAQS